MCSFERATILFLCLDHDVLVDLSAQRAVVTKEGVH